MLWPPPVAIALVDELMFGVRVHCTFPHFIQTHNFLPLDWLFPILPSAIGRPVFCFCKTWTAIALSKLLRSGEVEKIKGTNMKHFATVIAAARNSGDSIEYSRRSYSIYWQTATAISVNHRNRNKRLPFTMRNRHVWKQPEPGERKVKKREKNAHWNQTMSSAFAAIPCGTQAGRKTERW